MCKTNVSKATLGRLPIYLQVLEEALSDETPYISATTIARRLNLGEVQVRKDLAAVSGAGKPKLGYVTEDLMRDISFCLRRDNVTAAVLVGAGKLGRALLGYDGFKNFGVEITAAFDRNDQAVDLGNRVMIFPMSSFEEYCAAHNVRLGIITVGESSAQEVCDRMIRSGITAIWNFAPCKLKVPKGTLLQNENLALSLAYLNNQLHNQNWEDTNGDHKL